MFLAFLIHIDAQDAQDAQDFFLASNAGNPLVSPSNDPPGRRGRGQHSSGSTATREAPWRQYSFALAGGVARRCYWRWPSA
jgi:hypothetical protein